MKVCHITTVHPRYDVRIFWKECISLAEDGHEVYLIVNDDLEDEIRNGVRIVSIRCPQRRKISRVFSRLAKKDAFVKAKSLCADLYHFHDPELLSVGLKLKRSGFKVVYDSHEDVPRQILYKEWIPKFARKTISVLFEAYENKCVRKFDAVIVPTLGLKNRFLKVNESVCEIRNYPSNDLKLKTETAYSNKNFGCYVGDLTNIRGIREIAEATHRAGIELVLCGVFHSAGLEEELRLKYSHIRYMGFLSRSEIAKVLSESSMGFVTLHNTPNDKESYPIKMFEYMGAGVPVISSNFPIYKEIVEGNGCGICVDPKDVDAIVEAIQRIIDHSEEAKTMSKNGRNAVNTLYNWETQSSKLLQLYEQIQHTYDSDWITKC